jgi:SNARE protein
MSSDVAIYDEELRSLADQIEQCLRAMDSLTGEARLTKFNKAADLLKLVEKSFHHFKFEIRTLEADYERDKYEAKCQNHKVLISQLKEQLAQKRKEPTRSAAGTDGGLDDPMVRDDGKGEARNVKKSIQDTQSKALEALARAEATVQQTQDVGNEAATNLAGQTDQMRRMNETLDQLDSEVGRAKKELNAFVRRMMTDKIIICFGLLLVVGIAIFVIMKVVNKDDPPPPQPTAAPAPPPAATGAARR